MTPTRLLLIFITILLAGCQSIQTSPGDVRAQINILQHANKYDSALDVIDLQETPEEYALEREAVLKARDSYIKVQASQINAAIDSQEWYKARILVTETLRSVPQSERIHALSQEVDDREQSFINEKLAIQSLAEGQYLIQSIPTFERITESVPDKLKYRRELSRMQQRSKQLAQTLLEYAQVNFDNRNYQTAQDALDIATRLDPESSAPELQDELDRYWNKQKQLQTAEAQRQRKQALQTLETELEQALEEQDLIRAQELMARLWDMDAKNPIRYEQQRDLNEALANQIESGIRRGEQLYNNGDISAALEEWNRVLPLQPGHVGLNQRIARAERFMENLERLQSKKASEK